MKKQSQAITLQHRLIHLRENKLFEMFVITVILLSAMVIGAKTYSISPHVLQVFHYLESLSP